jgi:hypothetical protein
MRSNSSENTASFLLPAIFVGLPSCSALKDEARWLDRQILRNLLFTDASLTYEPDRLAFKCIRKLPSLHLTPSNS